MGQRLTEYRVFWREFRQAYHTTGAILPSGRALSRALSHFVRKPDSQDPSLPRRILEVGPGTGAVTKQIVCDMRPNDQLTLVERNEQFLAHLRSQLAGDEAFKPSGERIQLLHASVEDVPESEPFDLIISGLPLNNFSIELVQSLLGKMRKLLAPGGVLSFFEYVAIRRAKAIVSRRADRERLCGIARALDELLVGNEIRRDLVLTNVPPAWVHHVSFKTTDPEDGSGLLVAAVASS